MRFLSKFFSKDSIFHRKPSPFLLFDSYYSRESHFSTHSKSSKKHLSSPKASKSKKTSSKRSRSPSLYQKITQIISLDEATVNSSSSETLRSVDPEVEKCSQGACFNAQEKENFEIDEQKIDGSPISDVVPADNSVMEDVSPVVHRITQVVRAELSGVRMEERLDELCVSVSPEIVEKVLKRCFKVGHLAFRFFYWAKGQPGFCHTIETYNAMLCIAGEGREFDLMEKLVREMDEELCLNNVKTWTILVSRYGNANKVGKALWAFDQMRKSGCPPDRGVYEALLHALLNAGKSELAVEFYKEMVLQNLRIGRKLYEKLMTCLSMSGRMDEVQLVWNDMLKFSQVPVEEIYTSVLRSFCITGKVEEAQEVFEEIKKKYPSVQPNAYEILVKGLCRVGNMADAVKLVDDMKHSSVVDSKVYRCLIDGFLRKNDLQKALELLHCSRKSGTLPLVSSYTQMIQHLFRSDEYEKACELYNEMLEDGIQPDVVAMTAMVAGHVQNHCISKAWEVFESMKRKVIQPSWKAYTVFIKELCKASEPNEAVKLLNEMSESNINAGEDIVHLVECSLTRKGYVEKAKEVRRMFRSFKPHVQEEHSVFIAHEVSNSFSEPHVRTVQTSNDYAECNAIHVEYVCKIISSSTNWSLMEEALEKSAIRFTPELVRVALQNCQMHGFAALNFFAWVGKQDGYRHDTETYNMAIKISGSGKDFVHMRNLYREMKRRGCTITPNTWTIMISQYGQAGLTEISLKTYKEMKSEGHQPNGSTYKFLIVFLCGKKGRKVEEAIEIFQEMANAGYMPDREMLGIYLSSLCESGKLEHARKAVKSLCKQGFIPQLGYSLLIKSMSRAGKLEEALKLADEMEHLGCKMDQYIYGSIVHALLRRGKLDEALDKLEEMKRAGLPQSVQINTSLIVHFCKEKQIEKAIDIFKKMIEDGCEPTIVTYSSIIRGYMNMGMVSDAWCVFWHMKLKGPCPDYETYSMFITCLCKLGRSEEGLQLLHEMLQNGIVPSAVNFRTVFHGLNREGKASLAHNVLQTKWFLNRNRKFLI